MTRPRFGDYESGYRIGELGYELVERCGLKRFEASTYLCFGLFVLPQTKHVRVCRDLLQRALEIENRNGDLMWASYTSCELNSCRLFAGDPPPELQREAERGFTIAEKAGFGLCMDGTTTVLALSRTLRGLTPKFGRFDDAQHNELQFEYHRKPCRDLPGKTRPYRDLEEREAKIRRIVEANIVGILIGNLEGEIIEANKAFSNMLGFSRQELISGRIRWPDLTPAEWRDRDECAVAEIKATGTSQPFQKEYFQRNQLPGDGGQKCGVASGAAAGRDGCSQ